MLEEQINLKHEKNLNNLANKICFALQKKIPCFYIKINTGLKWANGNSIILYAALQDILLFI